MEAQVGGMVRATRALFALRYRVGDWLGWDDATRRLPVPGRTETTLSARVPEDLQGTATRLLVNDRRFRQHPMILETPKEDGDNDDMDTVNLGVLRGLVR